MKDSRKTQQGTLGDVALTKLCVADVKEVINAAVEQSCDTFSLFDSVKSTTPQSITLLEVMRKIMCDPVVRDLTEKHRRALAVGDTKEAERYKQLLFGFTPASMFAGGRTQEHIVRYTMKTCVDIDHILEKELAEMVARVRADEHTYMAYVTVSGHGLRVLCNFVFSGSDEELQRLSDDAKYMKEQYTRAFLAANEYYGKLLGMETDLKCKDPGRLSIIAHDPDAYVNPGATPFVVKLEKKRPVGRPRKVPTVQEAEAYVEQVLKLHGAQFKHGDRNVYVYKAACEMNSYGICEDDCTAWAVGKYEDADFSREEIATTVRSAYTKVEEHGSKQLPKGIQSRKSNTASLEEIEQYLVAQNVQIRNNTLSCKYEMYEEENDCWREIDDCDENDLLLLLSKTYGKRIQKSDLLDVLHSSYSPKYDPIAEYLESLDYVDDGIDYIDELASRVHVADGKQGMHNKYFKKWFVWMVAGWVNPAVVNQTVYVQVGPQGIFKSTFLRHLLPPQFRHMGSTFNIKGYMNNDEMLKLSSHLILELDEFDCLNRRELAQFKSVVTMTQTDIRVAYGRNSKSRKRIATFCGSTNNPHFLNDDYGNRRCFPVLVDHIDSPFCNPIDYEKLYAQAYHLLQNGFEYVFTVDDNRELNDHRAEFETTSTEEELIKTYFRVPNNSEKGEFFQTADMMDYISRFNTGLRLNKHQFDASLRKLGFEKKKITTKGLPRYGKTGYWVVPFTAKQREANRKGTAEVATEVTPTDASECINLDFLSDDFA